MNLQWYRLEEELPERDMVRQIQLGGKKLTLVRNEGKFYVFQLKCPHAGGVLAGGWCEHGQLVCPIHRYSYDLESGRGAAGQGDYINRYETEERRDGFYVGIPMPLWKKFFRNL